MKRVRILSLAIVAGACSRSGSVSPPSDFAIACQSLTITQADSATTACTLTTSSTVAFSASGEPNGMRVDFTSAAGVANATVVADGSVPVGSYMLTVSGGSGGQTKHATLGVTVARGIAAVHAIYIVPSDRVAQATSAAAIDAAFASLQPFYGQQLANGKNFRLATPHVTIVNSPEPAAWFNQLNGQTSSTAIFWDNVTSQGFALSGGSFFDPNNVWIYYIDADPACGQVIGGTSGVAVLAANDLRGLTGMPNVPACATDSPDTATVHRWIGGLGHELGHAFGLEHPQSYTDGLASCPSTALMWLGYEIYPNTYLLPEDLAILNRTNYFTVGPADVLNQARVSR